MATHRREHSADAPGADRDHRRPRHHRARGLPDREESLREARHPLRAAAGAQLRAGDARARITWPPSATSGGSAAAINPDGPRNAWSSSSRRCSTPRSSRSPCWTGRSSPRPPRSSRTATAPPSWPSWTSGRLFAERNGVDLKKVIDAIKVRPTHSNIIFPGPGIGGYCLPKDGGLGMWAYKHIFRLGGRHLPITPMAIDINDTRSLHAPAVGPRRAAQHGQTAARHRISCCWARPTARTWATPATAAPR